MRWARVGAAAAVLVAAGIPACTPIPAPAPSDGVPAHTPLESDDETADLPWDPDAGPPPLRPGDPAPWAVLEDASGEALSLADFRGRAVVLTFFETRGDDPTLCPELLDRMERLQATLPDPLRERIRLLAVSVDPAWDTPARLAAEARRRGADPALWTLATAREPTVRRLAAAFHVARWRRQDGSVGHTLTTAVLDRQGRLAARFPGTASWNDADLLAATVAAARR